MKVIGRKGERKRKLTSLREEEAEEVEKVEDVGSDPQ